METRGHGLIHPHFEFRPHDEVLQAPFPAPKGSALPYSRFIPSLLPLLGRSSFSSPFIFCYI